MTDLHHVVPSIDPPAQRWRAGSAMRSIGRLLARLVTLSVVLAAGAAGWLVADRQFFATDELDRDGVWPHAYRTPVHEWTDWSARTGGSGAPSVDVVAGAGLVQLTFSDRPDTVVEVDGVTGYARSPDATWTTLAPTERDELIELVVVPVRPARAPDLVPTGAEPFARVGPAIPVAAGDGAWEHRVVVDIAGFEQYAPLAAHRWRDRWGLRGIDVLSTTIAVDGDGRLLSRVDDDGAVTTVWRELTEPPTAEHPASIEPGAPPPGE